MYEWMNELMNEMDIQAKATPPRRAAPRRAEKNQEVRPHRTPRVKKR